MRKLYPTLNEKTGVAHFPRNMSARAIGLYADLNKEYLILYESTIKNKLVLRKKAHAHAIRGLRKAYR